MLDKIAEIRKAITAILQGAAILGMAFGWFDLSPEKQAALVSVVVAGISLVYLIPNKQAVKR